MPSTETIDQKIARLRKRKPLTRSVTFPDPDAVEKVEAAEEAVVEARILARQEARSASISDDELRTHLEDHPAVKSAESALKRAKAAAEKSGVSFQFTTIEPDVYDQFQLKHPPTKAQEDLDMVYNAATYVPALIAACSTEGLTVEHVAALMAEKIINQGELNVMFTACRMVNEQPRVDLGKE